MAEDKKIKRDYHSTTSTLSSKITLPNVVRIEALDHQARSRYLGIIQGTASKVRKGLEKKDYKKVKFYGFTKGGLPKSFGLHSEWAPASYSSGWMGFFKSVALGGQQQGGSNLGTDVLDIARGLTGISTTSTGSTTLKRFMSTSITGFTVSCGWYLPEQYLLCLKSLQKILEMAYPWSANTSIEGLLEQTNEARKEILRSQEAPQPGQKTNPNKGNQNYSGSSNLPPIGQFSAKPSAQESTAVDSATRANIQTTLKSGTENNKATLNMVFPAITDALAQGITGLADLFGRNLTFDPVPVRCSIGHYMDIEPLIIKDLNIEFSDNSFVNEEGKHLPLFCTVTINLDFWITPSPDLQFMSLLGKEMFGRGE